MKRLNKIKIKYAIISVVCIIIFLTILPTIMRYKYDITANAVGYAKETRQSTCVIKFHNNGGTGTMENMTITYNEAKKLTKNTITYTDHSFGGWNTEENGSGTSYSDEQEINFTTYVNNNEINLYAQWMDQVAEVNGTYYGYLQQAIDAVPNNIQTTVTLLADTSEQLTVDENKNIIFNLGNHKITNSGSKNSIFENYGTIYISDGTLYSNGEPAAINNRSTGTVIMTGGTITATSSVKGQAIYNEGGRVEISGTAELTSVSPNRATLHNVAAGIMKITGGTVISSNNAAVINEKGSNPVEIGLKDGIVNGNSPILQGETYGIDRATSGGFAFYDGIIKGKELSINNEKSLITDTETGYAIPKSEETINGQIYQTAYLANENNVVTVTFDPCSGTTNEETRKKEIGMSLGRLPTPRRTCYLCDGWFTLPEDGVQITPERIITNDITFYAQWTENNVVEMNGTIYDSVQEAINNVPKDNTPTTITLLKNTVENLITKKNQNIIFDLSNFEIKSIIHSPTIQNDGTLTISNGTIRQNSDCAAIDNHDTGTLIITGGNILSTDGRSAVFNMDNGVVRISGNPYIWSNCTGKYQNYALRGTVMNTNNKGNITITGGTIISATGVGVSNNYGTVTIGEKGDGIINSTSPSIRGETYGICSSGTFNYYDGIIKGIDDTISGNITDQEENTQIVTGTEIIDNNTYNTAILEESSE